MSNPNPERDGRVRQIREARETGVLPWSHLSNPAQQFKMAAETFDLLLSLLDSQTTDLRLLRIASRAAVHDAATRMRDRCVQKVKQRAAKRLREAAEVEEDDYGYSRALECAGDQLEEVASELQSLTLEGEQCLESPRKGECPEP